MQSIDQQILFFFNGSDSLFLDGLMTTLTAGLTWVPLYMALLYLVIKNNENVTQVLLAVACGVCCVALTAGVDNLVVKPLVARPRPCNDPFIKYAVDVVCRLPQRDYSFFSAHAANTSALAMFFILLVRNRVFTVTMVVWSLLNCYTRLYLGLHYPSDILCGLLFGTLMGIVASVVHYKFYMKMEPPQNFVSSQYTATGYARDDIDVVVSVLVFTLIYALIRATVIAL